MVQDGGDKPRRSPSRQLPAHDDRDNSTVLADSPGSLAGEADFDGEATSLSPHSRNGGLATPGKPIPLTQTAGPTREGPLASK